MDNLTLLAIALLNAFTAYMVWKTHGLTKQVELATNSMKDALVLSTGQKERLAGREEQRLEEKSDRAQRDQGRLEERTMAREPVATVPLQKGPAPVADDRTAVAAEASAAATERIADSTEKTEKKGK